MSVQGIGLTRSAASQPGSAHRARAEQGWQPQQWEAARLYLVCQRSARLSQRLCFLAEANPLLLGCWQA